MNDEERVVVRFSSQDLHLLNELVIRGKFNSEAEAVREIIRQYLDNSFSSEEIKEINERMRDREGLDLNLVLPEGMDASKVLNDVIGEGITKAKSGE